MKATFELSAEAKLFQAANHPRIVRYNGAWYLYDASGAYRDISEEIIRAWMREAAPYPLSMSRVSSAVDEIKAATVIDDHAYEPPCWLVSEPHLYDARPLIVCQNGILEPIGRTLSAHDDRLFCFNALPYSYDETAPAPQRWLRFLREVFSGDAESISELQKTFGYLVSHDTRLQRIIAIIGPTRSGKGTIGRILNALIGRLNIAGPSFNDLSGDFGLQSLIGKQVAIIADARITPRTDRMAVAERLLKISGEDAIDVPRKHMPAWYGRLGVRFVIMSNELPALPDQSGALSARYVLFQTPNSFKDRPDLGLDAALHAELPGILLWALEGLRRLWVERVISTPASARGLLDEVDSLGSPVKGFIKELCVLEPLANCTKDDLWNHYRGWHTSAGIPGAPLSKEMFSRALKTAYPGALRDYRPRVDGKPGPMQWQGVRFDYLRSIPSIIPGAQGAIRHDQWSDQGANPWKR